MRRIFTLAAQFASAYDAGMAIDAILLVLNLAATFYMTGLIWFVQVVHYPLFAGVGAAGFGDYHHRHTRQTTWAVGPAMLLEAATAVGLILQKPPPLSSALVWTAALLLAAIWLSTALLQVPCHNRLASGFDAALYRRLCLSNWIRTILWSVRGGLMVYALLTVISHAK